MKTHIGLKKWKQHIGNGVFRLEKLLLIKRDANQVSL